MAPSTELTAREQEMAGLAWLCVGDAFPKIDYGKLAKLAVIPTAKTANNQWLTIKKKLAAAARESDGANQDEQQPSTPVKPAATPKKGSAKRKAVPVAAAVGDGDSDVENGETRKKRVRKTKNKAKVADADADAADGSPSDTAESKIKDGDGSSRDGEDATFPGASDGDQGSEG